MLETVNSPDSSKALAEAISDGLARLSITPRALEISEGTFPDIQKLSLDLSGTRISRQFRLPAPQTPRSPGTPIRIEEVAICAHPLYFEQLPVDLTVHASQAVLEHLIPSDAAEASATLSVTKEALTRFLHESAAAEAAKQGVLLQSSTLELETPTPTRLEVKARLTAKMFIMSATVTISGVLLLDDQMDLKLSELECRGDGMIGSAANALLKPKFDALQARAFSLGALRFGKLRCESVSLASGPTIELKAHFAPT